MAICEFCKKNYPTAAIYVKPDNCNDKFRVCSEKEAINVSIFFISRYGSKEVLTFDEDGNILIKTI